MTNTNENTFINESIEETIKRLKNKEKELDRREKFLNWKDEFLKGKERRFEETRDKWRSMSYEVGENLIKEKKRLEALEQTLNDKKEEIFDDYNSQLGELYKIEDTLNDYADRTYNAAFDIDEFLERLQKVFHLDESKEDVIEELSDLINHLENDPKFRVEYLNTLMKE